MLDLQENRIYIANSISANLCDDIVYGNIAISLPAIGCKFGCELCHSKSLQEPRLAFGRLLSAEDFIESMTSAVNNIGRNITIVGTGGDFFFQLDQWILFCHKVKSTFGRLVKIVWYTGVEYKSSDYSIVVGKDNIEDIDAIVWGRGTDWAKRYIIKDITLSPHDSILESRHIKII